MSNSFYWAKLTFSKLWFSEYKKVASRSVFSELQSTQMWLNYQMFCYDLKIRDLEAKVVGLFYYFNFERIYDDLKSKSSWFFWIKIQQLYCGTFLLASYCYCGNNIKNTGPLLNTCFKENNKMAVKKTLDQQQTFTKNNEANINQSKLYQYHTNWRKHFLLLRTVCFLKDYKLCIILWFV